ncbi:MAG TPA: enoyl-CoA hydratase/isomerase family protein [Candidatus Binataceae bacterium]|nr:enoyl-CoA hydratase/isomerase family protein [Candidatus Binataceae bacterium]
MSTSDASKFAHIIYKVDGRVATITLNRPERLNAMDHGPGSMQREVIEALELADLDADVGCVVVTGAGRAFSSGGNLGNAALPVSAIDYYWFLSQEDVDNERIFELRKPVIGAINGICYGAALMMAAHFDILIASEDATFGLIEARMGGTGVDALSYLIGAQWAKFLVLSGELISASKAKEIGLVLEVFRPEIFEPKVYDLARRIASMPRDAVILNRRLVNASLRAMGWGTQKQLARALNSVTNSVGEEAVAADGRKFAEVRKAGWKAFKEARDAPFKKPWLET